jgi:hypothetical protein
VRKGIKSRSATVLPHVVLCSVRWIVGGLLGAILSWVLLRGFQQVQSRAYPPRACSELEERAQRETGVDALLPCALPPGLAQMLG